MSFFDPVIDAFNNIGDSVSNLADSDAGKLAMIAAAAYLTGGASAGAEATIPSWDILPEAVVPEGGSIITPASIAATTTAAPVAASQAPIVSQGIPSIPPAGAPIPPTSTLPVAGSTQATTAGELTGKGITDTAAQDSFRQQVADNAVRQPVPDYTKTFSGADRAIMNSNMGYQGSELPIPTVGSAPATSPFMEGVNSFKEGIGSVYDWAEQYPKTAIVGTYLGANALGLLKPNNAQEAEKYNGPLSRYKMSPDFQASNATPNIYKPRYAAAGGIMQAGSPGPVEQMSMNAIGGNSQFPGSQTPLHSGYSSPVASPVPQNVVQGAADTNVDPETGQMKMAAGGIAHFSKGNLAEALDFYKSMTESRGGKGSSAPKGDADVGIYYDQDPDTRYQDALTAAQIRQAKLNKRAFMTAPVAKRPAPMGQLNLRPPGAQAPTAGSSLDPEMAAQGGIMHASLGGYAAGGNPRLLKGPGDGMSDNIPATIAGKQPARLADGEFVIPADVVSHLGNGSTDAGAKRLHEMMNKVRKARTGNPKQGKQINPNKFMPA